MPIQHTPIDLFRAQSPEKCARALQVAEDLDFVTAAAVAERQMVWRRAQSEAHDRGVAWRDLSTR